MTTINDQARCVVLTPPKASLDADVRTTLTERGWRPMPVDDPYLAMVELCLEDRGLASQRSLGVHAGRELALVLADVDRTETLVAAVRRYVPAASIWSIRDGALALDHAATAEPPVPSPAAVPAPAPASTRPRSAPELRLAGGLGAQTPEAPPMEITAEEIEMLFEKDDEEAHTP